MLFELCIRFRGVVMHTKVGTLEECTRLMRAWTSVSTCYDSEYTYTLSPKISDILQD